MMAGEVMAGCARFQLTPRAIAVAVLINAPNAGLALDLRDR